jgi:hypothetical protein
VRKTTVYLRDEEAEDLRRLAATTGTSQAELIRTGVLLVLSRNQHRTFHRMGRGEGSSEPVGRWDVEGLARKVYGQD